MKVQVIDTPPGDAPAEVRQAWVGLVLPLAPGEEGPRRVRGFGILSKPTSAFGKFFRRDRHDDYYVVRMEDALAVLARSDSWALEWWQENAPHLLTNDRSLGFPANVCEEVK